MKFLKYFVFIISISLFIACGGKSRSDYYSDSEYDDDDEIGYVEDYGYKDGTYTAEIEYYNPNTGTYSTYTLDVEIEDNELTVIYWPNRGWLDDSHFMPPDISSGYAEFTNDKGYEYEVTILD